MPKYTFICSSCNSGMQKYVSRSIKELVCDKCNATMMRQLPNLSGPTDVTEVIDEYIGTTQKPDQRDLVEQRRDEYYWTVEVPRLVDSGTYTVETMLEMGWIYLDEKEQVRINDKPPHRR